MIFYDDVACPGLGSNTCVYYYYELLKTIVFWANIFFVLYTIISNYHNYSFLDKRKKINAYLLLFQLLYVLTYM